MGRQVCISAPKLRKAIVQDSFRAASGNGPGSASRLDWAATQYNLGKPLQLLGEAGARHGEPASKQAVKTYLRGA